MRPPEPHELPGQGRVERGAQLQRWRAFGGTLAELDLDFANTSRPALVSAVVHACCDTADDCADWTLHRRLQALLEVALRTLRPSIVVSLRCTHDACGQAMDVPLELASFRSPDAPEQVGCVVGHGRHVQLRLPTGRDQARWCALAEDVLGEAQTRIENLAVELVVTLDGQPVDANWKLPADWLDPIEATLAQVDPLTDLELQTQCPACDRPLAVPFDLEAELLRRFADERSRLLDEVHELALAYHWDEDKIVALPASRRREYLKRVNDGVWA